MRQKIFNVSNEKFILKEITKLQPLNYNQFRWWRRYDQPNTPLHKNASLLDKIKNGDLDFSHYWWQAKFTEIEMNEKYLKCIDDNDFHEKTQLDRTRRRRLYEDFEKDELEKLNYIRKEFTQEFRMTEEDYDNDVIEFDGTLEQFYNYCLKTYTKKLRPLKKRGRPRKL